MSRILQNFKERLLETCDEFRSIAEFDFSIPEDGSTCHLTKEQLVDYVIIKSELDIAELIFKNIGARKEEITQEVMNKIK